MCNSPRPGGWNPWDVFFLAHRSNGNIGIEARTGYSLHNFSQKIWTHPTPDQNPNLRYKTGLNNLFASLGQWFVWKK